MARSPEGSRAAQRVEDLIASLRESGETAARIYCESVAPDSDDCLAGVDWRETILLSEGDREDEPSAPFVRLPQSFIDEWDAAIEAVKAEMRKVGIEPAGFNTELLDRSMGTPIRQAERLLRAWRKHAVTRPPLGKVLLFAGLGIGALWVFGKKKRGEDDDEGMEALPFGALSSKSRSLRVGLMGGLSGLSALGGSFVFKDSLFGPIAGGTLGAFAFAALSKERFELDLPKIAVYGGASGLSGAVIADQFTADVGEGKTGAFATRAALGAFFGGAGAALGVDEIIPPEFKVRDDLREGSPAPVEINALPSLGKDVSLVDESDVPDDAIDAQGFVQL